MNTNEFIDFAHALADAAGEVIRPLFRTKVAINVKADQSPVTLADRQAEHVMRGLIMKRYPAHGILGEELVNHQPKAELCWVLDPIDGTKSFISGFPTFTTLISLCAQGVPILGIIDQPVVRERWVGAQGSPSMFNGKAITTRGCMNLKSAALSTTSPRLFNDADRVKFEKVQAGVAYVKYGYDGYAYAQLAAGNLDLVIEAGLKPYDFCALMSVIEGAGGVITDWQGKPLTMASGGHALAAGNKHVHAQALEILKA